MRAFFSQRRRSASPAPPTAHALARQRERGFNVRRSNKIEKKIEKTRNKSTEGLNKDIRHPQGIDGRVVCSSKKEAY
eukprot:7796465-Pyramimonas_sp.AAC.1